MNTRVESTRHKDKRTNIPTEELRDFVADEDGKTLLYRRDPSLDPQLVWKDKDGKPRRVAVSTCSWFSASRTSR